MAEPSMGNAKQFRGDSTDICTSSSPWFNAEDIPADSWTRYVVQIEDVLERTGVKFNKGRSRPKELTLKFTGHEKELVVNVTNRRIIDGMFTPATPKWIGKWVTLYVQGGITTGDGSTKNGIRFRDDGPKGAPSPVSSKPAADPSAARRIAVLNALVEFRTVATPGEYDTVVTDAGIKGRKPDTFTPADIEAVCAAMPEAFRPKSKE